MKHVSPSRRHALRRALAAALAGGIAAPLLAAGPVTHLPRPESLQALARAAVARGEPLVVLVSLPGCVYCEQVRRDALAPLRARGGAVVQVDLRDAARVAGFDGQATTHDRLTRAWGVRVAPTVLFFDAQGREVAERLQGASIPDFYAAYLEDRLDRAREVLRAAR